MQRRRRRAGNKRGFYRAVKRTRCISLPSSCGRGNGKSYPRPYRARVSRGGRQFRTTSGDTTAVESGRRGASLGSSSVLTARTFRGDRLRFTTEFSVPRIATEDVSADALENVRENVREGIYRREKSVILEGGILGSSSSIPEKWLKEILGGGGRFVF